jgi:predicted alpha/beta hydrolase family esterase
MKTQVVVIHGGDTFSKYEDYLAFLKKKEISLEKIRHKDWKAFLGRDLGDDFDVLLPVMPNKANSKYLEWKIWFEKIIPLLNNEIILIGHSMGGIFLSKYLSENKIDKTVIATFLVAAPYDKADAEYELGDFSLPKNISQMEKQGGKIVIYQSKDDPVVPFVDAEKYKKELPSARLVMMDGRQHFSQPTFPELVSDIKNLAN